MHSLQKQFHEFVQAEELLRAEDHVLVAISGGLDSMVLAELFSMSKWSYGVAHCNFNLRGKESNGDEAFVNAWAKSKGVEFFVKRFDLGDGSVQVNARHARYQWFEELVLEKGFTKIATAHHLNDSLETILINLSRGTGIKGMAGISTKTKKIIRPLMFASKDELRDFAQEQSLTWREDSSNAKTGYDRNLLRHEVIPKLQELNPSLLETFRNTYERLQLSNELVSEKVAQIRKNNLSEKDSVIELQLEWLHSGADLLVLSEILSEYGFNYVTSKKVYDSVGNSGKEFYSDNYRLTIDRNSLFLQPHRDESDDQLEIEGIGEFQYKSMAIRLKLITREEVDFSQGEDTAFLDGDLLTFPLKLRKWEEGDRFMPLGMGGTKNVSDYLIDEKVPVAKKDEVLVLLSGEEIVWLVGFRISEKFKVSDSTSKVMRIEVILEDPETSSG